MVADIFSAFPGAIYFATSFSIFGNLFSDSLQFTCITGNRNAGETHRRYQCQFYDSIY